MLLKHIRLHNESCNLILEHIELFDYTMNCVILLEHIELFDYTMNFSASRV